jgi:hypothetical protein
MSIFDNVLPFPGADKNATYLLLVSPESIPHLVLVHNTLCYSLTYRECEIGKDFGVYLQALVRAKRKMLFVELSGIEENPWTIFQRYAQLTGTGLTCIVPVKETILPGSKAEFVFELIPDLQDQGKIKQVYHLNMEPEFKKSATFTLRQYKKEAIYAYIQALNERDLKRQ